MKLNAERIRTLREQRAWSQEHLAAVAGLSTRTLQRIEAGAAASKETCLALAAALEVAVDDLSAGGNGGDRAPEGSTVRVPSWVMLGLLVVLLVVWFGYTVGKDAALRDNRVDAACESGAIDCR